ncbi:MAG: heme lyase CcmF/NrfE family subunit [Rhodospirillales bacterium]
MIPELGHYALVLALVVALAQSVVPLYGAWRGAGRLMSFADHAAYLQFGLLALSFAALAQSYLVSDFTVLNVVQNSHSLKPLLYKFAGTWGNHEGSLLLWVLMLAFFGAAVALFGGNLPPSLRARVLAIQALIAVGFLAFMLATSNPFLRMVPPPLDGNDLNPLLQDPGLALHPPLLYVGYVGFSLVFSFAVAALIEGRIDPAWARWVRPWTLVAWTALTAGIALGARWAYYELGWGGWWFWDPVENVSFMPWLVGTALLHCVSVVEKREAFRAWTVLLAILAFSLSLLGTFIVRSGLLTSVHAFAVDPERGVFILALLFIAIGGSLTLYAWRAPKLSGGGSFNTVSRESGLLLNNLLLSTACATVLVGTLYPLFLELITDEVVSVGPPFYNQTFVPLSIPLLVLMGIGPFLAWKKADLGRIFSRLLGAALVSLAIATLAAVLLGGGPVMAVLFLGLSAWLVVTSLLEMAERVRLFRIPLRDSFARLAGLPRRQWGMTLAHAGLGLAIAGMAGSTVWKQERIETLQIGQSMEIAGYVMTLESVDRIVGPNYQSEQASIRVDYDGETVGTLAPERRFYPVQQMPTTEAAIRITLGGDLYAVLGDTQASGSEGFLLRVYYEPLVIWIFIGTLVMTIGGIVSLAARQPKAAAARRRASLQPAE